MDSALRVSPRIEAMPVWLFIWYRMPFADRWAYEWMWHHGYWWMPPTLDWRPMDPT
jgi:hypothetical protein